MCFYCIDFDERKVKFKSECLASMENYVDNNDLGLSVAIVRNPEEIYLQFSLNEMSDLADNLGIDNSSSEEKKLASQIWKAMQEISDDISDIDCPKEKPKAKVSSRVSLNQTDIVTVVDSKCKKGSILSTIVSAVEEELCETVEEVISYITENHILPKSGELADKNYAIHNIKYFVKQGKITLENAA